MINSFDTSVKQVFVYSFCLFTAQDSFVVRIPTLKNANSRKTQMYANMTELLLKLHNIFSTKLKKFPYDHINILRQT